MSYLRKVWNNLSDNWKNIFITKFSKTLLKFSKWNTIFISQKFLEEIYLSEELDLQNLNITDLSGLQLTPNLKKINLNKNLLTSLDGIEKLTLLKELIASKNSLQNIYPLFLLKNLEFLDISYNQIHYLFPLFQSNLRVLYCNFNKIKSLDGLETIKTLEILDASNNKIEKLDFSLWSSFIREIWVAHNKIVIFDGLFNQNLNSLEILDLSFNPINKIDLPKNYSFEILLEGIE
jgi:protein phosphatase 1 regulatory subunit 7